MKKTLLFLLFLVLFSKLQAQTTYFVDATGTGNGLSWATASNDLQLIINTASDGDQIWVKQGIYQRGVGLAFELRKDVSLYGGFPNVANPTFEERNPNLYETILKGNQSRVLQVSGILVRLLNTTIIDGFTLTEGNSIAGSGLYNYLSDATFRNLKIINNISTMGLGAGVNVSSSNSIFYQVLVAHNTSVLTPGSDGDTAGMEVASANIKLVNCVITNNHAEGFVGGVTTSGATMHIYNSIIYGNTADVDYIHSAPNDNFRSYGFSTTYCKNSILEGSNGSDFYFEGQQWFGHYGTDLGGNFDIDPLFNDDYSLQELSLGINKGDSQVLIDNALNSGFDFEKNDRIVDVVDIGLFEYQTPLSNILYVKEGGTGNASSWENASGDLQLTMDRQIPGNQVWVAAGTYPVKPAADGIIYYFKLRDNIEVYGGFPATGNPTFEDRDYENNSSILTSTGYHVIGNFHHEDKKLSSNAKLDGFVVSSTGLSYAQFESNSEATFSNMSYINNVTVASLIMIKNDANPTFINSYFSNNTMDYVGSALAYLTHKAKAKFEGCNFIANNVTNTSVFRLIRDSYIHVDNCLFKDNPVVNNMSVFYINNSSADIVNSVFDSNCSLPNGSSVLRIDGNEYINPPLPPFPIKVNIDRCIFKNNFNQAIEATGQLKDTLVINNSLFYGNRGPSGGAIHKSNEINFYINNSTITQNHAYSQHGGGIFISRSPDPQEQYGVNEISNSIIYNNTAVYVFAQNLFNYVAATSIKNSLVQGSGGSSNWIVNAFNYPGTIPVTDLGGNIDANPMFIDPENENFRLSYGSPAINAGFNSIYNTDAIPNISNFNIDLDGNPRFVDTIVDIGAYEFNNDPLDVIDLKYENYIKIYPNPANDFVYIETEQFDFLNVTVFSIDGKQIVQTTSKMIDVSNYSKGIYIFQIELSNQKKYSKKIIVK
ncbi:T9SS C-terminal target domain-containing protein [Paenimyroides tangerinum]|uniref:T9SS C-terminal target domain-containing protein n=1 Tax=Paenimyroides tangerinum TaxID=2488728 RepID=A0A3P3WFC1_9FLAO|nr:T9SS type A sorting domain-containing protein [Paenimyroides tangerinum]RRJ93118.1 T9SS C-terminal target domain-containing protein [Paenimyroides tangerinum]